MGWVLRESGVEEWLIQAVMVMALYSGADHGGVADTSGDGYGIV